VASSATGVAAVPEVKEAGEVPATSLLLHSNSRCSNSVEEEEEEEEMKEAVMVEWWLWVD
jgi:hypothetical protein